MNAAIHPDPDQLAAYALGNLPRPEVEKFESHLEGCAECKFRLAALSQSTLSSGQPTITHVPSSPKKMVAGLELLRELDRGGLGVVYLARHPMLGDLRAIKRPQTRSDLDRHIMLARFRREMEAVGALRHDHIVRAHDAGNDDEGPYLVMEYLDGMPINRLLTRRRLQVAEACALIRQAALGLQAAHERGLIHRDIKPSNLMLARANSDARVVIIDWGLAKRANDPAGPQPQPDLTASGAVGTCDYMAPEQIAGAGSVDIRADIYGLGATLYCLLAGQPPFHGRTNQDKLKGQLSEAFPPLGRMRSDVPQALLAVLQKMVEKDRDRRYATPGEAAQALQPFCAAEPRLLDLLEGKEAATPRPTGRRPILGCVLAATAIAATVILLLASASVAWMLLGKTGGESRQEPNAPGVLGEPDIPVAMTGHPGLCLSLAFTANGHYAISESGGDQIFVWDLRRRKLRGEPLSHGLGKPRANFAGMVAVSPDGKLFAAASVNPGVDYMQELRLYDQTTFEFAKPTTTFQRISHAAAFSPDGSKLAVVDLPGIWNKLLPFVPLTNKKSVQILDVASNKWQTIAIKAPVKSLAFSPDNKFLITCDDEPSLHLWNLAKGQVEKEIAGHDGGADQVAFSADGKRIFSASSADQSLRVWSNDAGKANVIKLGNVKSMACCAFWPRGRALTGHADGAVILWDLDNGKELWRHQHTGASATAVAISPDGHHAVAALSDRLVYLYRLPAPPMR